MAALAGPAVAAAGEIVVATGPERGSYDYIGERLKTEILLTHIQRIELLRTAGSVENLKLLGDSASPVNVVLAQSDVLSGYLADHPAFAEQYFVLGDVGKECALLIVPARGKAASLTDLAREGGRVSVGDGSSGSGATFASMVRLAPRLEPLRPVPVSHAEALLKLKGPSAPDPVVAVMLVQRPRRVSPALEAVLKEPEVYRLTPIREAEVGNGTLPDGSPLYTYERVGVGGIRGGGLELDTLCMRGLLLGSKEKLTPEQRSMLSQTLLEAGKRIIGRDE
jgi:hypothetical protein